MSTQRHPAPRGARGGSAGRLFHAVGVGPAPPPAPGPPCTGLGPPQTPLPQGDGRRHGCVFCAPGQVLGGSFPRVRLLVLLPRDRSRAGKNSFLPSDAPPGVPVACAVPPPVSAFLPCLCVLPCPSVLAPPGDLITQHIGSEGWCFRLENHTHVATLPCAPPPPPTMTTSQVVYQIAAVLNRPSSM